MILTSQALLYFSYWYCSAEVSVELGVHCSCSDRHRNSCVVTLNTEETFRLWSAVYSRRRCSGGLLKRMRSVIMYGTWNFSIFRSFWIGPVAFFALIPTCQSQADQRLALMIIVGFNEVTCLHQCLIRSAPSIRQAARRCREPVLSDEQHAKLLL